MSDSRLPETKIGKNVPKWPQRYQIVVKYLKTAIKYQMAVKCTKLFLPKAFQSKQKLAFLV
jgi:hypothetical protein